MMASFFFQWRHSKAILSAGVSFLHFVNNLLRVNPRTYTPTFEQLVKFAEDEIINSCYFCCHTNLKPWQSKLVAITN